MQTQAIKIHLPQQIVQGIAAYQTAAHKQSFNDAVTDLLRYALTDSTRLRLLEALENTPDASPTLSEDEQTTLIERMRQDAYQHRTSHETRD